MVVAARGQNQHVSDPVKVTTKGSATRAAIVGEFDMAATFTIEPALEQALARDGLDAITVDLSDLRFIDSMGVGVLLRIEEESRARGVDLTIVPGPREVQRVFELAGLRDTLPFSDSGR
jgi:anti-anti-sigma factor